MSQDNRNHVFMHYYLYRAKGISHRERAREKEEQGERWRDSQKAGRNKDEGIGVGGWTIRRDHPMKPRTQARIQLPSALPFPLSVRGSFIGIKVISGRACEEERIYSFSCGEQGKIMRRRAQQTNKWIQLLKISMKFIEAGLGKTSTVAFDYF